MYPNHQQTHVLLFVVLLEWLYAQVEHISLRSISLENAVLNMAVLLTILKLVLLSLLLEPAVEIFTALTILSVVAEAMVRVIVSTPSILIVLMVNGKLHWLCQHLATVMVIMVVMSVHTSPAWYNLPHVQVERNYIRSESLALAATVLDVFL
jgi:DNA integrity scanning protein DisA with diadenylate cyclase activity